MKAISGLAIILTSNILLDIVFSTNGNSSFYLFPRSCSSLFLDEVYNLFAGLKLNRPEIYTIFIVARSLAFGYDKYFFSFLLYFHIKLNFNNIISQKVASSKLSLVGILESVSKMLAQIAV